MTDSPGALLVGASHASGDPYLRRLGQALVAIAVTLPATVVALTVVPTLVFALFDPAMSKPGAVGDAVGLLLVIIVFALLYGSIPAVCFGAPAYAWALWRGRASVGLAAALGAVPGLVLVAVGQDHRPFGWLMLAFGVPTALLTHVVARRIDARRR